MGQVAERELNSVIQEVAQNILVRLGIKPAEQAAEPPASNTVEDKHTPTTNSWIRQNRNRLLGLLAGLVLAIAAYYLLIHSCYSIDPPFECKFNQQE